MIVSGAGKHITFMKTRCMAIFFACQVKLSIFIGSIHEFWKSRNASFVPKHGMETAEKKTSNNTIAAPDLYGNLWSMPASFFEKIFDILPPFLLAEKSY